MLDDFSDDVRLFHALKYPGRTPTLLTTAGVVLGSRGLLLLAAHRVQAALAEWGRREGPARRLRRSAVRLAQSAINPAVGALTKSELRVDSRFDGGVFVSDRGQVVIGARAVGRGTVIHDRVTIGWGVLRDGVPEIGRDVWIGPNAVVVGNITVGDGATILPNTVLTRSVPARSVVGGNPARFLRHGVDNARLRATLATDAACIVPDGPS